jgi:hypothetical protein
LISLSATNRGEIQIYLSSPSGTRSTLLQRRPLDNSRNGFHSWPFMSIHFWGESPFGVWTLEIQNEGRFPGEYNNNIDICQTLIEYFPLFKKYSDIDRMDSNSVRNQGTSRSRIVIC